jgi:hypothetical protein
MPTYGYERFTRDIDILFEPTEENAKQVVAALQAAGYDGIQDIPLETILTKKVLLRDFMQQADTHPKVTGSSFEEAWASRMETTIMGMSVFVPSLDVMMTMKRAAGRSQDLVDLERLEKLKERKKRKPKSRG